MLICHHDSPVHVAAKPAMFPPTADPSRTPNLSPNPHPLRRCCYLDPFFCFTLSVSGRRTSKVTHFLFVIFPFASIPDPHEVGVHVHTQESPEDPSLKLQFEKHISRYKLQDSKIFERVRRVPLHTRNTNTYSLNLKIRRSHMLLWSFFFPP